MPTSGTQLPLWLQYLQAFGPLLATIVSAFAVLVSVLSYYLSHRTAEWQAYVSRETIRQNDYDRRFEIFIAFRDLLVSVLEKDNAEFELRKANAAHAASNFLLNEQIRRYLEELYKEAFCLDAKSKLLKDVSWRASLTPEQLSAEATTLPERKLRLANRVSELAVQFEPFLRPEMIPIRFP